MITKRYKIFEVEYEKEIISKGYDDGYGRETRMNPILKGCDGNLDCHFDTKEEAETAIDDYVPSAYEPKKEYVILEIISTI